VRALATWCNHTNENTCGAIPYRQSSKQDHYILVIIDCAFPEYRKAILPTHRVRDYMIYIAVGIAVVLACAGFAVWSH